MLAEDLKNIEILEQKTNSDSDLLLDINNVSIAYKSNKRCILDKLTMQLKAGEMVALSGPSGLGKSTLFKAVIGDPHVSVDGDLCVLGNDMSTTKHKDKRKLNQNIAYIQQSFNIIERLSVLDNVLSGAYDRIPTFKIIARHYPAHLIEEALHCLDTVGLSDKATELCQSLSGGQKQRVAIARVMMQKAKLVLADEPIASLDPRNADIVFNHLKGLSEQNIAICIILHQPKFIQLCDREVDIRQFSQLN